MILPAFDSKSIRSMLVKLDSKKQLAFGAVCCERLLPNYTAFQNDTGWGDITPIRKALDLVWSIIENKLELVDVDIQTVNKVCGSCEFVAPDSEDFESLYVSSAQDACFAVCCLLDYLLRKDVDKIVQVATYATDSVDLYVQEIENLNPTDEDLEQKILTHHLMQRELAQQEKDFLKIEQASRLDSRFLDDLRKSWKNNGKSNLDLPKT